MIPMKYSKIGIVTVLLACGLLVSQQTLARPDVNAVERTAGERRGQLKTTASCRPAEAAPASAKPPPIRTMLRMARIAAAGPKSYGICWTESVGDGLRRTGGLAPIRAPWESESGLRVGGGHGWRSRIR